MVQAIFGSDKGAQWSYSFDHCTSSAFAWNLAEVLPLLAAAERAARSGAWVAVMISYEAAGAFDRALMTSQPSSLPLAWCAFFEGPAESIGVSRSGQQHSPWQSRIDRTAYGHAIDSIRELIAQGDTYQVNYTFSLTASFCGEPRAWYEELCHAQGAGYCAYLDLGNHKILSLSPELFFERRGDGVITKPMKGTMKRGRWQAEDQMMAHQLSNSEKDRAENVMIVDLLRNDLGKVSAPGSVHVTDPFALERYETLWQMTSTVISTLRPNTGLVDLLTALFPCGSITGAPKIRTMEIIKELEVFPRGIYTGAIGLIKPGGDCIFNVAIRTLALDSETGEVTCGVGGGITYDSTAEREYEECLLKASFLERQVAEFRLLETMRLDQGEIFLLERHLARLRSSAEYFGFAVDLEAVRAQLFSIAAANPSGVNKIRLLVDRAGAAEIQGLPIETISLPVRVALAKHAIDSADSFLFHKTTNRAVYDAASEEREDCDDVILWNERGEVTESTIANVCVSIDGEWFTPPRESGLMAGTLREELLATGKIRERVITVAELKDAGEIALFNSVRKWMPAVLVPGG